MKNPAKRNNKCYLIFINMYVPNILLSTENANFKKSWILLEQRTVNGGRNKESVQDIEVEKKHKT